MRVRVRMHVQMCVFLLTCMFRVCSSFAVCGMYHHRLVSSHILLSYAWLFNMLWDSFPQRFHTTRCSLSIRFIWQDDLVAVVHFIAAAFTLQSALHDYR